MRWLIVTLLAIGPLSLLQGVAWVSMALQADISDATTSEELFAAIEENLSTPCHLCKSVEKTQEAQDKDQQSNHRFEVGAFYVALPIEKPVFIQRTAKPDPVRAIAVVSRSDQPELPPPRA